jgi:dTDP-4-dehydrorhamnose reductase
MKLLVLGAGGRLGASIAEVAQQRKLDVMPVYHEDLDITEWAATASLLEAHPCDVVVNCTAFHNVGLCEQHPDQAEQVNTFAVAHLALVCKKLETKLVHVSTDYVFPGTKGQPYIESDMTAPLQVYGRTKLAGEYAVLGASPENLVVRTASLFGGNGRSAKGGDFPEKMLALAEAKKTVEVRTDLRMSPTYAPALASSMLDLILERIPGLVHLAGVESATWYDVALEFIAKAHIKAKVKAVSSVADPIPRPAYSVLRSEKVMPIAGWSTFVEEYLKQWHTRQ